MGETKKLQGKLTVITGGTTGIGLATAKLFVKEGAYVFITGRRQKELDEAVKAIGNNVTGVQGDIAKLTDLDRLFDAVATKGRIDVIFANAGVAEFAPFGKITEEHFDKLFDTNVKGNAVYGAESLTAAERWWLDYSQRFSRERKGYARLRCLRRDEGRPPLIRPNLDLGSQGPPYSFKRCQPGSDRYANCGWAT
jgi:NAD(P)-dependent dehydrogenase (short-subunit alcohol dehydrogenase family)